MDVTAIVGILECAKRDIGRSLGVLRATHGSVTSLTGELEKAYEKVKWVQDEIEKL